MHHTGHHQFETGNKNWSGWKVLGAKLMQMRAWEHFSQIGEIKGWLGLRRSHRMGFGARCILCSSALRSDPPEDPCISIRFRLGMQFRRKNCERRMHLDRKSDPRRARSAARTGPEMQRLSTCFGQKQARVKTDSSPRSKYCSISTCHRL